MNIVLIVVVLIVSWIIGVIGFSQIIGSLQTRQPNFFIPIIVWAVILLIEFLIVKTFLPAQLTAYGIGTAVALVTVLSAGKIQ